MSVLPERNAQCPCGSGKKYKKCCLNKAVPVSIPKAVPVSMSIRVSLGEAMQRHQAGKLADAELIYRQILRTRTDLPEVHYQLGLALGAQDKLDEAVNCYRMALVFKADFPEALNNLGHLYNKLSRWHEALPVLRKALALKPQYALAHNNLGITLDELGYTDEAITCYRKTLSLKPNFVDALHNLGSDLLRSDHIDEATRYLDRALSIRPDAAAHLELGIANVLKGDLATARRYLEKAIDLKPTRFEAYQNRLGVLNYQAEPPGDIYGEHRNFADRFELPLKPLWPDHPNARDPARRLKVGYVSPDFRGHSVALFMEPILAHHDKRAVEVYCYYNNTKQDAMTERLKQYADHWIPCRFLTDEQLAKHIMEDGIDILVDLAGHTGGNRLLVFARKPAPVQVSYLGYPATTGLSAMDYRLVTADTDPDGAEHWHTERLYRLPRSLWCYRPAPNPPSVEAATPARRNGTITFGSMNNITKISEAAIAVWSELLQRVPGSTLVMTNVPKGETGALIAQRFAKLGIASDRLQLRGKLSRPDYEAQLSAIDIALDPFPYAGTTTTCDVLWHGIPVVTLIGNTSVARSGYALLKLIGLTELAAPDTDRYLSTAAALATNLDQLEAVRRSLRARLEASPLRDEVGMANDLDIAYRSMWQAWCADRSQA